MGSLDCSWRNTALVVWRKMCCNHSGNFLHPVGPILYQGSVCQGAVQMWPVMGKEGGLQTV